MFAYSDDIAYSDDLPYTGVTVAVSITGSIRAQQITGEVR